MIRLYDVSTEHLVLDGAFQDCAVLSEHQYRHASPSRMDVLRSRTVDEMMASHSDRFREGIVRARLEAMAELLSVSG